MPSSEIENLQHASKLMPAELFLQITIDEGLGSRTTGYAGTGGVRLQQFERLIPALRDRRYQVIGPVVRDAEIVYLHAAEVRLFTWERSWPNLSHPLQ
jgi:hypothetical protein